MCGSYALEQKQQMLWHGIYSVYRSTNEFFIMLGVPFGHLERFGLCRSSRQAAVPLLYEHQRQKFHLGQKCLWVVQQLWLVRSIFELQSLQRIIRQVCVFQELS
jgi:hypothetical protein